MRYMLLFHYPEMSGESLPPEVLEAGQRAMASYATTLAQAGVLVSAQVLQPSTSTTTLRLEEGELRVQDGPFADTRDQLGGIVVIDAPDLDAAISWARQAPPLQWGAVEVRPGAVHTTADGAWVPSA